MEQSQDIEIITGGSKKPHIKTVRFSEKAGPLAGGHDWENVPELCIITGRNGSGKTHLLRYIDNTLNGYQNHPSKFKHTFISAHITQIQSSTKDKPLNLDSNGMKFLVSKIRKAYDENIIQGFFKKKKGLSILAQEWARDPGSKIKQKNIENIIYKLLNENKRDKPNEAELERIIQETLENIVISNNSIQIIQQICDKYQSNSEVQEITEINKILKFHKINWELLLDGSNSIYFKKNTSQTKPLGIGELSAGERMVLEVVFWLYITENESYPENIKPHIMIMDEPDSHLDPTLIEILFKVIYQGLVKRNNMQVIFVSHRTDTVALAPPESIFYLERCKEDNKAKIVPIHRLRAMFRLISNLRGITNIHFQVYAEGFADANFYQGVYHSLLRDSNKRRGESNGSKKKNILSRRYQLNFVTASGSSDDRGGGCGEVIKCLHRNRNSIKANSIPVNYDGLQKLVELDYEFYRAFGILDNDNIKEKKVQKLEDEGLEKLVAIPEKRHSLESFFLDPFIFCPVLAEKEIKDFIDNSYIGDQSQKEEFIILCTEIKKLLPECSGQIPDQEGLDQIQKMLNDYFRIMFETIVEYEKNQKEKKKSQRKASSKEEKKEEEKKIEPEVKKLEKSDGKEDPKNTKMILKSKEDPSSKEDPLEILQSKLKKGPNLCDEKMEIIFSRGEKIQVQYPKEFLRLQGHYIGDNFIGKNYRERDESGRAFKTNVAKLRDLLTQRVKEKGIEIYPEELVAVMLDLNKKVRDHVQNVIKREGKV